MDELDIPIPDTGHYRAMRSGHRQRHGHALKGYLRYEGLGLYALVRTCCQEDEA